MGQQPTHIFTKCFQTHPADGNYDSTNRIRKESDKKYFIVQPKKVTDRRTEPIAIFRSATRNRGIDNNSIIYNKVCNWYRPPEV